MPRSRPSFDGTACNIAAGKATLRERFDDLRRYDRDTVDVQQCLLLVRRHPQRGVAVTIPSVRTGYGTLLSRAVDAGTLFLAAAIASPKAGPISLFSPVSVLSRIVAIVMAAMSVLAAGIQSEGEPPLTTEDGRRLELKLVEIFQTGATSTDGVELSPIVLPEREINAYLRFQAASQLPVGVTEPWFSMVGEGRVIVAATVDLSAVRDEQARGMLDPLRYVSGLMRVTAQGTVVTANGIGRLEVESATVGGVTVPIEVLLELVRHYSRSETRPNGIDPAEPFQLPYRIREVFIEKGKAIVSQ